MITTDDMRSEYLPDLEDLRLAGPANVPSDLEDLRLVPLANVLTLSNSVPRRLVESLVGQVPVAAFNSSI